MQWLIDSHAHLCADGVFEEVESLLSRGRQKGVGAVINIATDPLTLERAIALKSRYPEVFVVAATTPHDAAKEGKEVFPLIAAHAKKGDLVAIGETGLEYHWSPETKEEQQELLRQYLQLALEVKLPVVIHCRDAFDDLFQILDEEYVVDGAHGPGILHCFTGSLEEAKEVIGRGWYLSLSGIVTFKKSDILRQVAGFVPNAQLLIETDTPYLAPEPHRGKRNEPAYLLETAAVIAQERGVSVNSLAKLTADNACRAFGLDLPLN